jgi:hypothetical protein
MASGNQKKKASGNQKKKAFRRKARELALAALPKKFAHRWIRNSLDLAIAESNYDNLKIELASSVADLKAALTLVQKNFEREGYAQKSPGSLRLTPFHLLPQTVVIVAKINSRVVATTTVIPRTKFGIPLDSCCQLDSFLTGKGKIVEVSALAVDSEFRGQHGSLLFNLMKYMYHCNVDTLQVNMEVIGVNPRMISLYEAILLFKNIPNAKMVGYDFANGAPVVPMYFNLDTAIDSYTKIYKEKPAHQNVMNFFLKKPPIEFSLPTAEELDQILPQRNPEKLRVIIGWNLGIIQNLNQEKRSQFEDLYRHWPECLQVIREAANVE